MKLVTGRLLALATAGTVLGDRQYKMYVIPLIQKDRVFYKDQVEQATN